MTAPHELLRVLIASERLDLVLPAQSFLETADYEVEVMAPAVAAVSCATGSWQLLLLDVAGPLGPACALLAELRGLPAGARLAIMCALEEPAPKLESQLIAAGADDCLPWSLSRSELLWRVRALLQFRALGGEPGQLVRVQRDELLALSRRREETLSLLVHDMKNPLSGVISNAEYLQTSQGLDADQLACAQDILQASRRLHRMVLSLLDVAQSEDGQLRPVPRPLAVRDLVDETHAACSARLRDKNVSFEVVGADPELVLAGDHDMLLRLLANLLDNAAVAAPSGTKVELSVQRTGQYLELRFSDLGPSVPLAERAALLSEAPPARTVQDAPRPRGRRGLGLRACRVIAEAHGGRIWVEDRTPQGATIGVRLPIGG